MIRAFVLVVLALSTSVAFAQDPEPTSPPEPIVDEAPDETIYVYDQVVARTKQELEYALRDMGYDKVRASDGRQVFVSEVPWRPQVILDDDAWIRVKRAPVQFGKPELPGIGRGPLGYAVCIVAPTSCVRVGGIVVSKRKLQWAKTEVVEGIQPSLLAYENAVVERAMASRTGDEVPTALDLLWEQGVPLVGEGTLPDVDQRKAALATFWLERADNAYGDRVRVVVENFVNAVVQTSDAPFTADEVAAINARRTCLRRLDLVNTTAQP